MLCIIAKSSCPSKKEVEWEKIKAHSVSKEDGVEVKERYGVGIAILPSRSKRHITGDLEQTERQMPQHLKPGFRHCKSNRIPLPTFAKNKVAA